MLLLAFLGNPGKKYDKTRHNIGFIVGKYIANELKVSQLKNQFSGECSLTSFTGRECLLLFPQTFMNLSGQSIAKAMDYYNISPSELIVVHDDLELSFADVRTKFGGGHKGHNGLRSIIQETGSPDFHRVRFGIGRPSNPQISVADYVLSNFTKEEMDKIEEVLPAIYKTVESLISKI
ncbi:MAG TPA: aminoacyl-tRNA hydrolase [Spirochaetota bacterium]|jgi:PTH1 family peptidyl-tRNA hydrolase|nr:aminoacyl-tRNA hydrolase [Spirochaetota bacterium]OQA98027.1 MAG: Peptidyl-tRNA hydrolase [Spirochaetes bacterium ADurb.Bin218]HOK00973.1 aminoacyl-tRNA hydrolase [Spirochaetota bacterium]HOK91300.1 aminoacyl-tRNA hydrolase [Spirochaetota bacterium]HON14875.1 aminoacyl-tRNA hydrolase [Spirochaetota bacterium]